MLNGAVPILMATEPAAPLTVRPLLPVTLRLAVRRG